MSVPGPESSIPSSASLEAMAGVDAAIQTLQQTQFSLMADAKANIMITVCSLVLAGPLLALKQ